MLTIEHIRRLFRELGQLPLLTRVGLLTLVVAGAVDVGVHLAAGDHGGHSGIAHTAHILGIVGMVLVLAGVVVHGALPHIHRRRQAANSGGIRDAHR